MVWLCILCFTGCGLLSDTSPDFAIRVCGTEGLKFSGHYSIVGTNTLPEPITAQGVIPMEYKGRGTIALCSFRKLTEEGSLKVEILRNGKAILESETNIPYGFVSIKTPIPEKDTIIAQLIRKVFGNQ
jgi:hypothetical protein